MKTINDKLLSFIFGFFIISYGLFTLCLLLDYANFVQILITEKYFMHAITGLPFCVAGLYFSIKNLNYLTKP